MFTCTIHRPPRPTHFPYTTLFRSGDPPTPPDPAPPKTPPPKPGESRPGESRPGPPKRGLPKQRQPTPGQAQDRKSTRLNSSHGYISYAVFCLKKKKKIIQK